MPRPLSQFMCGCSLEFGVKVVMGAHFMLQAARMSVGVIDIIIGAPVQLISVDYSLQCVISLIGLLGMPFIFSGFLGMATREEAYMRVYLYYCMACWLSDTCLCTWYFVINDPCTLVAGAGGEVKGSAQICGGIRMLTLATVSLFSMVTAYLIFVVWSFCESMRVGGAGDGLRELNAHKEVGASQREQSAGLFGTKAYGVEKPVMPVVYGSIATMGIGGGALIFGHGEPPKTLHHY